MDPHLEKLRQELGAAMSSLSPAQLNGHPSGKWSVAEILEHLYLSYTGTILGFNRLFRAGKSMATKPTWKHRSQTLIILTFGYMPSGRQAPSVARPRGLPREKVLSDISSKITEMDDILTRCASQFGSRRQVLDHPILGPLSVDQWRKLHLVHGLHHIKQIRRLQQIFSHEGSNHT